MLFYMIKRPIHLTTPACLLPRPLLSPSGSRPSCSPHAARRLRRWIRPRGRRGPVWRHRPRWSMGLRRRAQPSHRPVAQPQPRHRHRRRRRRPEADVARVPRRAAPRPTRSAWCRARRSEAPRCSSGRTSVISACTSRATAPRPSRRDGRTTVAPSSRRAHFMVSAQQGERRIRIYTEYRLSPEGDRLDVLEVRSTRPRPIHFVFHRADA